MKYCIGCKHLNYTPPDPGCMGSTWTGVYGEEDAKLACDLGYWAEEFGADATIMDFRRAMEKAETCEDFSERDADSASAPQSVEKP